MGLSVSVSVFGRRSSVVLFCRLSSVVLSSVLPASLPSRVLRIAIRHAAVAARTPERTSLGNLLVCLMGMSAGPSISKIMSTKATPSTCWPCPPPPLAARGVRLLPVPFWHRSWPWCLVSSGFTDLGCCRDGPHLSTRTAVAAPWSLTVTIKQDGFKYRHRPAHRAKRPCVSKTTCLADMVVSCTLPLRQTATTWRLWHCRWPRGQPVNAHWRTDARPGPV